MKLKQLIFVCAILGGVYLVTFLKETEIETAPVKALSDVKKVEPEEAESTDINKNAAEGQEVQAILLDTRKIKDLFDFNEEGGASETYKEVALLDLKGEERVEIVLDEVLENVASVVLVPEDGEVLIKTFQVNQDVQKGFKEGEESFEGDWIKLDGFKGRLEKIYLETRSKEKLRLKVLIQYLGNGED